MVALFLTTTISCYDAVLIVNRIQSVVGLTQQQKVEIIQTVRKSIPTCPLKVVPNERPKPNP